jgi:hypothetical protein
MLVMLRRRFLAFLRPSVVRVEIEVLQGASQEPVALC